ncbi:hypothetical protein ACFX5Q_34760, partial [Mesorhizobium sp. IMUNJ 23033]
KMADHKTNEDTRSHDHEIRRFAAENRVTIEQARELIAKYGNSRIALGVAAQKLRGGDALEANFRNAWAALRLVRAAIEQSCPAGVLPSEEAVLLLVPSRSMKVKPLPRQ